MMELFAGHWPIWLMLALALVTLLAARFWPRPRGFPYGTRAALLTPAEQRFYRVLRSAAAVDWDIFAMVRLADLIQVKRGTQKRQRWQNRINAKHIDFVICDPATLQPRLAIELDDRSHQRADRVERDRFVDEALEAAGLPLLRVKVQRDYDVRELRRAIQRLTNVAPSRTSTRQRRKKRQSADA